MDALTEKSIDDPPKGVLRKSRRVIGESQPNTTEKKSRRVINDTQTEIEDDNETLESGDSDGAYEQPGQS